MFGNEKLEEGGLLALHYILNIEPPTPWSLTPEVGGCQTGDSDLLEPHEYPVSLCFGIKHQPTARYAGLFDNILLILRLKLLQRE